MLSSSATILPERSPESIAKLTLPWRSRRAWRSTRRALRRLTRPSLRVRLASTPLRIHTSSWARNLSKRSCSLASASSHSALCSCQRLKLPGKLNNWPRSSSTMRLVTWSRKLRSWVIMTQLTLFCFICCSSQAMPSKSKWLVGSSSNNKSASSTKARAKAMRLRVPPESPATLASGFKPSSSIMACALAGLAQSSVAK